MDWFESNLPEYGDFTVRLSGDWAVAMFGRTVQENVMRNRARVELRHHTTEVSMENCRLSYVSTYQVVGGDRTMRQWVIPFAAIDLATLRIQPLELSLEVRAMGARIEVYMHSLLGQYFIVTDADERTPRSSLEVSIPINGQDEARDVVDKIRNVNQFCGSR